MKFKNGDYVTYKLGDGYTANGHIIKFEKSKNMVIVDSGYGGAAGLKYVMVKDIVKVR